ncbi:MAG: MliC protein [Patescibacteria group bacterium]|nr:MliC protein [Patescibacteria group bacterium]
MNTKTTIVILIILLVLVGWFAYDKGYKNGVLKNSNPVIASLKNEQSNSVPANSVPSNITPATPTSPDIAQIVSQSIVGVWKSTQDEKFTREFTNAGVIVDYYDNKAVTTGTWVAFTNQKPLKVSFPLEKEVVYIQMTTTDNHAGIPDSTLNFKLTKLTPEILELIYMDRGGMNTFTRIQ